MMRALLLAGVLAAAGSSAACGGRCQTDVRETTFELAMDELRDQMRWNGEQIVIVCVALGRIRHD